MPATAAEHAVGQCHIAVDGPQTGHSLGVTVLLRIGGDFASGIEQLAPVLAAGPM
jgi:hypothetical protein